MSGLSPRARALIDRARLAEEPTPADAMRVATALTSALGAATAGPTAAAAAAKPAVAAKVALLGAALGVGVVVCVVVALGAGGAHGVVASGGGELAPRAVTERRASIPPSIAPATSVAPPEPPVEAPPEAARPGAAPRSPAPPAASSLRDEAALLRRAQEALQRGDSAAAQAALDEHARRYLQGALGPEREAARAVALCQAGQREAGERVAARFLAAHPDSPLVQRVRDACASR